MFELVRPRRRRSLRRAYRTRCQAVRLDGFRQVGDRILDLSHRGALVACDEVVFPGDELLLSFAAPSRDGQDAAIVDAVGEVQRVLQGRRRGDLGYAAGVRFVEMEWDARAELFVRLAGTPPPVPRRRAPVDYAETVRRVGLGHRGLRAPR